MGGMGEEEIVIMYHYIEDTAWDRYYWNLVPDSKDLLDKVTDIKGKHLWNEVIDEYREKKNLYLCRQDYNHPSFNVYVETVNQVFNKYFD